MMDAIRLWWFRRTLKRAIKRAAKVRRRNAQRDRDQLASINKARFTMEFWSGLNRTIERPQR